MTGSLPEISAAMEAERALPDVRPLVVLTAAGLAACGGGGGAGAGAGAGETVAPPVTDAGASRFLAQAGFGGRDASVSSLKSSGYAAWLDNQFALPPTQGHYDWMVAQGYAVTANLYSLNGVDNSLWRKLIGSPDELRQRVVLAFSEIFVISMNGLPIAWPGFAVASYLDMLEAGCFGTYRQLLEQITLSVGMGSYLNLRGNLKGDPATGRLPDENYAREVLQLFSVGLYLLNQDGSLQTDSKGQPVPTYDQSTITGLARVFTGWNADSPNNTDPGYTRKPMINTASRYDSGEKTFLGATVAAGADGVAGMKLALDTIALHPNAGPFLGRQLIQRLVTSNPSPAYIGRVAAVFANNGQGVRGDLKAVIKAVLLDPEARNLPSDLTTGKLREPVVRFLQWARAFKAGTATGQWGIGDLSNPATRLGMSPLRSPTVFNFFRPGYIPPNSLLAAQNLSSPEMQLTNESTVVGYLNFMQTVLVNGMGDVKPDYSAELTYAADPVALTNRYALLLTANQLAADTLTLISGAVASIAATTPAGQLARVQAAIFLVMASPEYLVQK